MTPDTEVISNATLRTITPRDAGKLLETNTFNRPIRRKTVLFFADEMRSGRWKITGDTIKVAGDGVLLDGQHRLLACIESGVSFDTYFCTGLDRDGFDVIDTHTPRRPSDALSIHGLKGATREVNVMLLAASLAWVYRWETGQLASMGRGMSNSDAIVMLEKHPGIREFVNLITGTAKLRQQTKPSIVAACFYLFARQNDQLAREFMEKLASGAGLLDNEPVYLLRERLVTDRRNLVKLPPHCVLALFFKAWNHTKAGKKVRALAWKPGNEPFPNIGELEPPK